MEKDEESGFCYHGARYLALGITQWLSSDSHGIKPDINVYRYANDNPLSFSDRNGKQAAPTPEQRQAIETAIRRIQDISHPQLIVKPIHDNRNIIRMMPDGTAYIGATTDANLEAQRISTYIKSERMQKTIGNIVGGAGGAVGFFIGGETGSDVGAIGDSTLAFRYSPHPLNNQQVVGAPGNFVHGAPTHNVGPRSTSSALPLRRSETDPIPVSKTLPAAPVSTEAGDASPKSDSRFGAMKYPTGIPEKVGKNLAAQSREALQWDREFKRNVVITESFIDGKYNTELVTSTKNDSPLGTIEWKQGALRARWVGFPREYDAEFKFFTNLLERTSESSSGYVSLYTERIPCESCQSIIVDQFKILRPGIQVTVTFEDSMNRINLLGNGGK
jgi:RHS repeat-associated protein